MPALTAMNAKWYSAVVNFSFYETLPGHLQPKPPQFLPFTNLQREAARASFELIADVANISFAETADVAGAQPWIRFQTVWVTERTVSTTRSN